MEKSRPFRGLRLAGLALSNLLLVLTFIFIMQYMKIEIFFRDTNVPFAGDQFYNPYDGFNPSALRANFHAHSKAHDEYNTAEKVYNHYKEEGYDLISLSDYQKITTDNTSDNYISVYEHGYNANKSHQLVLNGNRATFFDFSIVQNFHTRQQVINKLKQNSGYIALAHPGLFNAYKTDDMNYLKGYDFIEVFNNYKLSPEIWDAALTSGYPAWLLANDDCHDITRQNIPFCNWNRIGAESNSREDVLDALKRGCHYGYRNTDHIETNFLDSCIVEGSEMKVWFRNRADRIVFRADNGEVRKIEKDQDFASYTIAGNDSYVRVEAETGNGLLYLNPVIRYNGYQLSYNNGFGLVNSTMTILVRAMILIFGLAVLTLLLVINGRAGILARVLGIPSKRIPSFT